ncbi:MAG: response regulator [Myxococcales bacterium]
MSQARAQMRARFLVRASERLGALGNVLLALESRPTDNGLADELMREIHTLKGEAKLMQLAEINAVAHETEEVILAAHAAGFGQSLWSIEYILKGFDAMRHLVEIEQGAAASRPDVEELKQKLSNVVTRLQRGETGDRASLRPPAAQPARLEPAQTPATAPVHAQIQVQVAAPAGEESRPAANAETEWLFRSAAHMRIDPVKLDELGKVSAQLLLNHQTLERSVAALQRRIDALHRELEGVEALLGRVGDPSRIARDSLEQVLTQLGQQAREWIGNRREARKEIAQARDRLFQSGIAQDELQARLRNLRLQPIAVLFERFPRAARDLAVAQGKRVRVEVRDAEVYVDGRVLERLGEPLLHLVRNAIDHGMETPAAREALGKPATATLRLSAEQVANTIQVTVEDDGGGVDLKAVRERALRNGIVSPEQAETLPEEALIRLIFRPGFSTRDAATDISGRGVGLDAVARTLSDLGGSVRVESEPGKGTRFVLVVPGSLLLKPVLVARVGEQEFAIGAQRVDRVLRISPSQIESVGQRHVVKVEGQRIPLADLATALGVASEVSGERSAIVVSSSGRVAAFLVDVVLGQKHVLQRPAGLFIAEHSLLEGVAITEAGSAVLLLSVDRLVDLLEQNHTAAAVNPDGSRAHRFRDSVLVVDDSEVTRELIASILRNEGLDVVEAVNGREALERLRAVRPSVVLSDLEMPLLDGFGLLGEIRRTKEFADLPVIMFTTRGSETDKRKGAELGASAYLVKGNFDEDELISTVRRFLKAEVQS